jgi:hypothetical protein
MIIQTDFSNPDQLTYDEILYYYKVLRQIDGLMEFNKVWPGHTWVKGGHDSPHFKTLCFFHNDTRPSLKMYLNAGGPENNLLKDVNIFICHSCGFLGDIVQVKARIEKRRPFEVFNEFSARIK